MIDLLSSTRRLTVAAVVLLGFQLYGNLYEELVTNVAAIARPTPGGLVGPLDAGSPMFFYLPWVPVGLVLVFVLAVRIHRSGPRWVARRVAGACGALVVAVAVKVYLIGWLNPTARDRGVVAEEVRATAIRWAVLNGIAVLAVATALVLIVSWRGIVADRTDGSRIASTLPAHIEAGTS
jgi:hypothetical protein